MRLHSWLSIITFQDSSVVATPKHISQSMRNQIYLNDKNVITCMTGGALFRLLEETDFIVFLLWCCFSFAHSVVVYLSVVDICCSHFACILCLFVVVCPSFIVVATCLFVMSVLCLFVEVFYLLQLLLGVSLQPWFTPRSCFASVLFFLKISCGHFQCLWRTQQLLLMMPLWDEAGPFDMNMNTSLALILLFCLAHSVFFSVSL